MVKSERAGLSVGDSRNSTYVILFLFFLSGAAGLIYQVVWTRLLTLTFGSTVFAVSAVLTAFMAGLGLGSFIIGRIGDRIERRLQLYGLLEIIIGLYALIFPVLLLGVTNAYVAAYRSLHLSFFSLSLVKFALATLILLLPTALMGGTLPLISRHLVGNLRLATRSVAYLYALNTAGAVAGTVTAGFLFIPELGLRYSLWIAVLLNLLVGTAALVLARKSRPASPALRAQTPAPESAQAGAPEADVESASTRPAAVPSADSRCMNGSGTNERFVHLALMTMFVSGFISLAYEVVWTRTLVLYMGSTNYTYSTMLTAFLFGIAAGSFVVGVVAHRIHNPFPLLALAEVGIGASILFSLPALGKFSVVMESPSFSNLPWSAYHWSKFGMSFAILLPSTFLMGATFPLAAQVVIRDVRHLGRSVADVYSLNTLGAILGAGLAGFLMIPRLGPGPTLVILGAANLLLGAVLLAFQRVRSRRFWAAVPLALTVLLLLFQSRLISLPRKAVTDKIAQSGEILAEGDGLECHVAVNQNSFGFRQLWVNGDVVARSTGSVSGHNMLGHMPMLFARQNRATVVIALGTGISAGSVGLYQPDVLDIVEISDLVLQNVGLFAQDNNSLAENPKANFIIDDGRNFVQVTDQVYDVIAAEPLHPWKAGVANLYTREYYELCKRLLKPGGVAVQWIPLYGLSDQDAKDLTRTFIEVFPQASYWLFGLDAVLLGHHDEFVIDLDEIDRRTQPERIRADLEKVNIGSTLDLINHFVMGPNAMHVYAEKGRVMSDWFPFLEYEGPKHVHQKVPNTEILKSLLANREDPSRYISTWGPAADSTRAKIQVQNQAWGMTLEGLMALQEGNLQGSIQILSRAVDTAPWLGDTRYYLSRASFQLGAAMLHGARSAADLDRAAQVYARGLDMDPNSPSLLLAMADVSQRLGRKDAELGYLRRLADVLPLYAPRARLVQQALDEAGTAE